MESFINKILKEKNTCRMCKYKIYQNIMEDRMKRFQGRTAVGVLELTHFVQWRITVQRRSTMQQSEVKPVSTTFQSTTQRHCRFETCWPWQKCISKTSVQYVLGWFGMQKKTDHLHSKATMKRRTTGKHYIKCHNPTNPTTWYIDSC